jgi:hypothetical protein
MVSVTLGGPAKQFASLVIGAIQSAVSKHLNLDHVQSLVQPLATAAPTGTDNTMKLISNLSALSTSASPPNTSGNSRDNAMLFIAHAAIWSARCCIYGGFIRDFIVNNESPNDIDIGYETSHTTQQQLQQIILQKAAIIGLDCIAQKPKGMAFTLTFSGARHGWTNVFDVDLVDLAQVRAKSLSPGVDCDVGNLVLEAPKTNIFALKLKVKNDRLISLAESQRHCQRKEFVFYYRTDDGNEVSKRRLDKYLSRGWTCLTQLQGPMLTWAQATYPGLLKPKAQYSIQY